MGLDKIVRLEALVGKGLLTKSETVDTLGRGLVLYNYTNACTYAGAWDEDTLNARGTIYDKATGEVVAQAFPKFFNLGENGLSQTECFQWDKPLGIFEKVDGSLGIVYPTGSGGRAVATRGSFHSDQAKRATLMLSKYNLAWVLSNITLLVEIVYPENRIMVDYKDREELVLLAAFDGTTELPWETVEVLSSMTGMPIAEVHEHQGTLQDILMACKEWKWNEREGWVIRFNDGQRVKIKCTDYLRVAKLKAHMGPLAVWEAMSVGKADEYLQALPEELRVEAESIYQTLDGQLDTLLQAVAGASVMVGIPSSGVSYPAERKEKAMAIQKISKECGIQGLQGVLLSLLGGTPVAKGLMRKIKPSGNVYVDVNSVIKG